MDSAYCGNGLVEEGEECDCGDEFQCLTARQLFYYTLPCYGSSFLYGHNFESFLAGRVVPLPQEEKTCSLAGFHPSQHLQPSNVNNNVSERLRSQCAIGENVVGANEVGANEVKADRIEEEAKEENMTAEKVIEEEKKYVKSTRLCQFFNIC